jgi:AcrR family transcriptional regulator
MSRANPLKRRAEPRQLRSEKRIDEILEVTVRLLAEVGLDDLTTVLIAREIGISVGSVYHYFPNKFAILFAVGERWLENMTRTLRSIESRDLESMDIETFADQYCNEMLKIYRRQIAVLPLVRAMFTVPELRVLDERHDEEIINGLMSAFRRLGVDRKDGELNRMGRLVLEMTHAAFLVIVNQNKRRGAQTLADLRGLLSDYLDRQMASNG